LIERHAFRAMGTEMELLVEPGNGGAPRAIAAAVAEFERLEQIMSRFRPDSELSRLNRDRALDASPDLVRVIELALDARERTGGRFDPSVHDALVAAGYDRTFDDVEPDGPPTLDGGPCRGGAGVHNGRIELEPGVKLDLGGIGKGYAAERAAELLALAGPCLVNAGGDIAVRGGAVWPVGVETADGQLTLALDRGGLATSGRDRRRWTRGGQERHHLIDPRTGRSAQCDLVRVTVVAGDAVEAEVLAKFLFLAGAEEATRTEAAAVLVTGAGETVLTGALR
jgi:thiamine biosynthesis lipoprotein